jgi:hypothetical protein
LTSYAICIFGQLRKNYTNSPNIWHYFSAEKAMMLNLTKYGLGYNLGDFSQKHLVALLLTNATFSADTLRLKMLPTCLPRCNQQNAFISTFLTWACFASYNLLLY